MIGFDVLIADVSDDLAEFIRLHPHDNFVARQSVAGPLQEMYEALGHEVVNAAVPTLDLVLTFFRVVKGQFWIPRYTLILKIWLGSMAHLRQPCALKLWSGFDGLLPSLGLEEGSSR